MDSMMPPFGKATPSGDRIVSAQSVAVSVHQADAVLNSTRTNLLFVGETPDEHARGERLGHRRLLCGHDYGDLGRGGCPRAVSGCFRHSGERLDAHRKMEQRPAGGSPSSQSGGMVVGWNRSRGQAETNLFNVFNGAGKSFVFSQVVGNDCVDLVTIGANGSLTVTGGVAVTGGVETDALAATGPVAVIATMGNISAGQTYTAATDDFLCATVGPLPPWDFGNPPPQQWESVILSAWFPANPTGGLTAIVTGGYMPIQIPDGVQMLFAPQSGMIPVAKGQSYSASQSGNLGTTNIWWVPFGTQS